MGISTDLSLQQSEWKRKWCLCLFFSRLIGLLERIFTKNSKTSQWYCLNGEMFTHSWRCCKKTGRFYIVYTCLTPLTVCWKPCLSVGFFLFFVLPHSQMTKHDKSCKSLPFIFNKSWKLLKLLAVIKSVKTAHQRKIRQGGMVLFVWPWTPQQTCLSVWACSSSLQHLTLTMRPRRECTHSDCLNDFVMLWSCCCQNVKFLSPSFFFALGEYFSPL